MSIFFKPEQQIFLLQMPRTTYAFAIKKNGALVHLYWGQRLDDACEFGALLPSLQRTYTGSGENGELFFPTDNHQYEFVASEPYSFKEPALDVTQEDGARGADLYYLGHHLSDDGLELTVTLKDRHYPLAVDLIYTTYTDIDVLTRKARIRNIGDGDVHLHNMQSASLWLPSDIPFRLTHFSGEWGMEYERQETMLPVCRTVVQNNRGTASGPHAVPFVLLDPYGHATETAGEVFAVSLHWSGNFKMTCERTVLGETSVSVGVNNEKTTVHLGGGELFETPAVSLVFSANGFAGVREQVYDLQFDHLLPREQANTSFPVLYNSWYPYEFHIDEEKISGLIDRAADVGIELFVIDDGWMPGRDCDVRGLGDWVTDSIRFPNGLRALSDKAHARGMKFGLWIEPEMVNPDSDLYRQHPDWVLGSPTRPQTLFRNQLTLNLGREDVVQYAIECLDRIITDYNLDYIKWDMNRDVSDFGGYHENDRAQDALPITYIQNVYRIWQHMRETYPHLLLENCAHGGARCDYGMVTYADRINRSDNAHPNDVLLLHEGFTEFMPPKLGGGAGTFSGRKEIPYSFRETLGFTGSLSLGTNLLLCSEEELAQYKASIAQFKTERDALQDAYVYHLRSARNSPFAVWEYTKRDRTAVTVFGLCFGRHFAYDPMRQRIRLTGLLPDAVYECVTDTLTPERIGKRFTGSELMHIGISLPLCQHYDAVRCSFKKV